MEIIGCSRTSIELSLGELYSLKTKYFLLLIKAHKHLLHNYDFNFDFFMSLVSMRGYIASNAVPINV